MVEVKVGTVLSGQSIAIGESNKGPWAMCEVRAEKGYDVIKVWIANVDDIVKDADLTITEILSGKITNTKSEKTGKWYSNFNLQVKVKAEDLDPRSGFTQMPDDEIAF